MIEKECVQIVKIQSIIKHLQQSNPPQIDQPYLMSGRVHGIIINQTIPGF